MLLHEPGSCTVLIDSGAPGYGRRVSETLRRLGVDLIDMAVISHPHPDHFGGLPEIERDVAVGALFDNGMTNPDSAAFPDYLELRGRLEGKTLRQGETLRCGSIAIDILYPPDNLPPGADLNETSLVLLISYRGTRLLHMGDLSGAGERNFLAAAGDITAEVLKVAHHGAADATSPELLQRVRPKIGLISAARENRIGAPAPRVLKRLLAAGVRIMRTDRDGDIALRAGKDGYRPLQETDKTGLAR